ncbi:MAG: hypothetical protein KJ625_08215 [Actinobacteria bacterium]|nr:hypothetical protein [Actinomycetota bacterium]
MPEEAIPEESIIEQVLSNTLEDLSTKPEFPDEIIEELKVLALSGQFCDATALRQVLEKTINSEQEDISATD